MNDFIMGRFTRVYNLDTHDWSHTSVQPSYVESKRRRAIFTGRRHATCVEALNFAAFIKENCAPPPHASARCAGADAASPLC